VEPEPETKLPAEHLPHIDDPNTLAKLPGVHASQTDATVAPKVLEKVPREHNSQADDPVSLPQLPGMHFAHCEDPAAAAKLPISQRSQSVVELGTGLNFPASHAVHSETPPISAKLPGAQTSHKEEPLMLANLPAEQEVQSVVEFASNLNFPNAQATHWDDPAVAPKVPALHTVHPELPVERAKLPATQGTHISSVAPTSGL
jgi:hypothetical protein